MRRIQDNIREKEAGWRREWDEKPVIAGNLKASQKMTEMSFGA